MQLKFPESRRLTFDADDLTHRWSRLILTPFGSFQQKGHGRRFGEMADPNDRLASAAALTGSEAYPKPTLLLWVG